MANAISKDAIVKSLIARRSTASASSKECRAPVCATALVVKIQKSTPKNMLNS